MPYGRFHEAAELASYDVEILAARFGASFEQVAHRLTTLARQTARGVPFFLVRVDMAGNVSKRFSSSRFPFAHSGGTCPLWNVHATFAEPGKILTQVIELPDGSQWFSIARTVRRSLTPSVRSSRASRSGLAARSNMQGGLSMPSGLISQRLRRRRSGSTAVSATAPPARSARRPGAAPAQRR